MHTMFVLKRNGWWNYTHYDIKS